MTGVQTCALPICRDAFIHACKCRHASLPVLECLIFSFLSKCCPRAPVRFDHSCLTWSALCAQVALKCRFWANNHMASFGRLCIPRPWARGSTAELEQEPGTSKIGLSQSLQWQLLSLGQTCGSIQHLLPGHVVCCSELHLVQVLLWCLPAMLPCGSSCFF